MKVVSLDLHAETTQMFVSDESGQVLLEMPVPTEPNQLRRVVSAIPGPKCVVFEEGPLSALIRDALGEVAREVVSCDPAYNALIARDEDSDDERDARHLEKLFRLQAVRPVYIPPEPYLSLRSLLRVGHGCENTHKGPGPPVRGGHGGKKALSEAPTP